ncbi:lytic transglycosylase domain-containing protein [Campylobacter corcagiensis]|uniref:Lytic transglycosylase domain-containing protein n=1 Tax=Campylobacter corcagiensis TaxID=1448857 RepID=A0A7M1LHA9_9BACT|nr:lytic transglycosylase domain-containing protein [Campylobacter corcagiensis]QKF64958.1 soluble lytic murein transglycosylase [Campylobacter corcagiensis]QOQ86885.1 lytic transglycosylase domain-containing protein [Campylobacter corcagiensis]
MIKKIVIFLSLVSFGVASVLSYEELKTKPKSLAKDYYIYRLMTEGNVNDKELKSLRSGVFRDRGKLKTALDKRIGSRTFYDKCKGVNAKNILDANLTCKLNRLGGVKFVSRLSPAVRNSLASELSSYPDVVNLLNGINSENPAKYFANTKNVKNFFSYFKSLDEKNRANKFNFALSPEFGAMLGSDSYFKTFITDAVVNQNLVTLRKSLIDINPANFDSQSSFYLGINAIKFKQDDKSVKFFNQAINSAKTSQDSDKANLWIYLVTSSEEALLKAANSKDLNMYSLYAKELTGNTNLNIVIPKPTKNSVAGYDEKSPFDWVNLKAKVKNTPKESLNELATKFDTKKTQGEYIYIKNIADGYPDNFYPTPFMEHIGTSDKQRQALILAIARQESRFIQSAISISYALGMMQFMPFVANDWASKHDFGNFDQDDVFKPEVAYKMANIHLDWLERYLYNPVFIAYAYNGGIGFTKRMITQRPLFKDGKYEPFLSMELVHYAESREYAKRVLANYVVYSSILNPSANISIIELINNLTNPAKTDSYRK